MSISKAFTGSIPAMYGTGDSSTPPSNEVKLTAINVTGVSDAWESDYFGRSVAVGSGRIVVGAYNDDDTYTNSGSAYVFDLDGNLIKKLTASDPASGDNFGYSVAVGSSRIVIGAYGDDDGNRIDSGSAYVFDLNGNEPKKLTAINATGQNDAASGDNFGYSVAVGNGRIVVGAYKDDDTYTNSGSAYVFDLDGNLIKKLTASDPASGDNFGNSVAVGNGRIVIGSHFDDDTGSVYVFDLDGNLITKLTASDAAGGDRFGYSVAVGSGRIVVGVYGDDSNSGSAYVFDLDGNQLTKLTAADVAQNDNFGYSVAVGSGRIVIGSHFDDNVGGTNSGSAYVFDLDGNLITKLTASDADVGDEFGNSVAVGNGRIVVGSQFDNDTFNDSGSAYIYTTPNVITPYDVQDWERG